MKARCYYPKRNCYEHYGGRGIKVCEEWKNSFIPFYEWSMENGYKDHLEIDREEVDGNYEPNNCRWVTRVENLRNKRKKEGCSSKYIGVCFDKSKGKFMASIRINRKNIFIGRYTTEKEAAIARDEYVKNSGLIGFNLNFKKQ